MSACKMFNGIGSGSEDDDDDIICGTPSPVFARTRKVKRPPSSQLNINKAVKSLSRKGVFYDSDSDSDVIPVKREEEKLQSPAKTLTANRFGAAAKKSPDKKAVLKIRPYMGLLKGVSPRKRLSVKLETEKRAKIESAELEGDLSETSIEMKSDSSTAEQTRTLPWDEDSTDSIISIRDEDVSGSDSPSLNDRLKFAVAIPSDSDEDHHINSSSDISETAFDELIRGAKLKDSGTNASPGDEASDTNSASPLRINKKHHSGHKGRTKTSRFSRTNDFVRASSLLESPSSPPQVSTSAASSSGSGASFSLHRRLLTPSKRPNRKRKAHTLSTPSSAGSSGLNASPSTANESMTQQAVDLVSQMEKDEEMARKLQEDLDKEYATMLSSSAPTPVRPKAPPRAFLPTATSAEEDVEARIALLSDWEWQVHLALVQGIDAPPPPANEFHQRPDDVIDPQLIEYLAGHPEAIQSPARRAVNNRRQPSSEFVSPATMRAIGEIDSLLPMVLGSESESGSGPRVTRSRSRASSSGVQRPGRPSRPSPDVFDPDDFLSSMNILIRVGQRQRRRPSSGGARSRRRNRWNNYDVLDETVADGNDYEELLDLEEQLGAVVKKGLTAGQIGRLPTKTYVKDAQTSTSAENECQVCMSDYQDGDKLRILPCFHNFHEKCIDKWIKDNPTCPVCRTEIQL